MFPIQLLFPWVISGCGFVIVLPSHQCFWCQDWGHQAMGCTREAQCGCCAGPHTTADHTCAHAHPCPAGQRCNINKLKCINCQGDYASWTHTFPAAKAAFETQAQKEEYTTGKFESYTPFTFADTDYTPGKTYEGCPCTPTPPPSHPQFNLIPATSPLTPTALDA